MVLIHESQDQVCAVFSAEHAPKSKSNAFTPALLAHTCSYPTLFFQALLREVEVCARFRHSDRLVKMLGACINIPPGQASAMACAVSRRPTAAAAAQAPAGAEEPAGKAALGTVVTAGVTPESSLPQKQGLQASQSSSSKTTENYADAQSSSQPSPLPSKPPSQPPQEPSRSSQPTSSSLTTSTSTTASHSTYTASSTTTCSSTATHSSTTASISDTGSMRSPSTGATGTLKWSGRFMPSPLTPSMQAAAEKGAAPSSPSSHCDSSLGGSGLGKTPPATSAVSVAGTLTCDDELQQVTRMIDAVGWIPRQVSGCRFQPLIQKARATCT